MDAEWSAPRIRLPPWCVRSAPPYQFRSPPTPRLLASVCPLCVASRVGCGPAARRFCWRRAPAGAPLLSVASSVGRGPSVGGCAAVPCRRVVGTPLSPDLLRWSGRRDSNPPPSPWQGVGFGPSGSCHSPGLLFRPPSFHLVDSVHRCSRAVYYRPRTTVVSVWPATSRACLANRKSKHLAEQGSAFDARRAHHNFEYTIGKLIRSFIDTSEPCGRDNGAVEVCAGHASVVRGAAVCEDLAISRDDPVPRTV